MRSISWNPEKALVEAIDQSVLPNTFQIVHLKTAEDIREAIRTMVIRGAPIIGVAAFYAMALRAREINEPDLEVFKTRLDSFAVHLSNARPTAVNLQWAIKTAQAVYQENSIPPDQIQNSLLQLAHDKAEEDVRINKQISTIGADLIQDGDHIVHHCNTGALATVDYGTALGCIRMAAEQGKRIHVYVDETRPRLQGSRLTAWELDQYRIPYEIITDSSSGYLMRLGKVDRVFFGADRVALNGDVVNKIGTYMLALAAYDNGIEAYSVFPISTIDFECPNGEAVTIEERDPAEILNLSINGRDLAPKGAKALNYAFDVTPHRLLDGLVTEKGVLRPPFFRGIAVLRNYERNYERYSDWLNCF